MLRKFGITTSLGSLIEKLQTGAHVSLPVGNEEAEFAPRVGVKQGGLGPVIFIFSIETCLRSLDSSSWTRPSFTPNFVMRCHSYVVSGDVFEFPFAVYADDGAFVSCSRV